MTVLARLLCCQGLRDTAAVCATVCRCQAVQAGRGTGCGACVGCGAVCGCWRACVRCQALRGCLLPIRAGRLSVWLAALSPAAGCWAGWHRLTRSRRAVKVGGGHLGGPCLGYPTPGGAAASMAGRGRQGGGLALWNSRWLF